MQMNETSQLKQNIVLGTGGNKPGVGIYDTNSGVFKRILSLSLGQSVYALDVVSADSMIVAAGTKNGEIYRLTHQPDTSSCCYHAERLTNRVAAPVLSVCFPNHRGFAASDTVGRCLQWLPSKPEPDKIPTGRHIICSLFRLDDDHMAGLSTSSQLLIWAEGDISEIVEVPGPPKDFSALVEAIYWHAADRWVWPGSGGVIVFYRWPARESRSILAHSSEVYAIVVCGDELLTIGTDGSVKRWCASSDEPVGGCEGPERIISAALWGWQESRMLLLIKDTGEAGVYSWNDNQFGFIRQLSGGNFRIAVGPDMQKVESMMRHQKAVRARKICVRIREAIAEQESDDLEELHRQLVQSGHEHVSLALRAEEYRHNNDIVSELQCYRKLAKLVPKEDKRSKPSLLRYAELLEAVWQQKEACSIYEQLAQMNPDNDGYAESMCRASRYVSIIEDGKYVIEPDIPLLSLVKSATALNEMFIGRYVVKNIREPINCNTNVSADEFIKKHTQVCTASNILRAEKTNLWWISKNRTEQATTIILRSEDSELFHHLELAIKFLDALQTVLVPVVVFNAGNKTNEVSSLEQHNQDILEELQRLLADSPSLRGWLKIVYGDAMHIIRQLITKAMADRNQ